MQKTLKNVQVASLQPQSTPVKCKQQCLITTPTTTTTTTTTIIWTPQKDLILLKACQSRNATNVSPNTIVMDELIELSKVLLICQNTSPVRTVLPAPAAPAQENLSTWKFVADAWCLILVSIRQYLNLENYCWCYLTPNKLLLLKICSHHFRQ